MKNLTLKKAMKKLLILTLVIPGLAALCLWGCNPKNKSTTQTASNNSEENECRLIDDLFDCMHRGIQKALSSGSQKQAIEAIHSTEQDCINLLPDPSQSEQSLDDSAKEVLLGRELMQGCAEFLDQTDISGSITLFLACFKNSAKKQITSCPYDETALPPDSE